MSLSAFSTTLVVPSVILAFISTPFIILRFWSRRLTKTTGPDDWLAAGALIIHHAALGLTIWTVCEGGMGQNYDLVMAEDPDTGVKLLKGLFAYCLLHAVDSTLVKTSVLVFYWRAFPTSRTVRTGCVVVGILATMWFVGTVFAQLLICRPIAKNWNMAMPGHCVSPFAFYTAISAPNSVLNTMTLLLPLGELTRLRLCPRQKLGVCVVYLLGGIVVAASIARLTFFIPFWQRGLRGPTQQAVMPWLAGNIEIFTALVAASLPTLMPAWKKLTTGNQLDAPEPLAKSTCNEKPSSSASVLSSLHGLKNIGRQATGRSSHAERRDARDSEDLHLQDVGMADIGIAEMGGVDGVGGEEEELVLTPPKEATKRECHAVGVCPKQNMYMQGIRITQDVKLDGGSERVE